MSVVRALEAKKENGIFSLVDQLTNRENATPFNIPPLKKTEASKIVDVAIAAHLALIPEPEYVTVHCPERVAMQVRKRLLT